MTHDQVDPACFVEVFKSVASTPLIDPIALEPRLERAFDFAARQVRATVERYPDYFPIYTAGGRWFHSGELWTDWCGGFHAGMMWLIAERTGDAWWRQTAEHYSRLLEHRQHDRNVHDLGFIFLNTYLPWYRGSGDDGHPSGRDQGRPHPGPAVQCEGQVPSLVRGAREPVHRHHDERPAHLLGGRETRQTRPSSTWPSPIAARPSGPWSGPTARRLTRGSSTWTPASFSASPHIKGFGPTRPGRAGWPGRSTASARSITTRTIRPTSPWPGATPTTSSPTVPTDLVPPWDFDVPAGPDRIDDSSAAAIAASGLWNLAGLVEPARPAAAARYRQRGTRHSRLALHRPIPRLEHARLGRCAQARRLSFPQEAGRR